MCVYLSLSIYVYIYIHTSAICRKLGGRGAQLPSVRQLRVAEAQARRRQAGVAYIIIKLCISD